MSGVAGEVVKLVTRAEREVEEMRTAAHADSEQVIAIAAQLIAEAKAAGRRVTGVAVALTYDDGAYGSLVPVRACDYGHLLGAVADLNHRLLLLTNE